MPSYLITILLADHHSRLLFLYNTVVLGSSFLAGPHLLLSCLQRPKQVIESAYDLVKTILEPGRDTVRGLETTQKLRDVWVRVFDSFILG